MELIMQEQTLRYLSRVLCETIQVEQTADIIIPDSYPDADRVIESFGNVLIRNAECVGSSASVVGNVQAGVLFATAEGEVHSLAAQIPFSLRRELAAGQENCNLQCHCVVRSVDARLLNSRKLLLRATVSCMLSAYKSMECHVYDVPQASEKLQLKRMELPLRMPLALGEKSFSLNEELELPSDKPPIAKVMKTLARPQLLEQKVVGSKAVFKAELMVHILYADSEDQLHTHDWLCPFSQYAELDRDFEEAELQCILSMSAFDVEQDSQIDSRRVFLSAAMLAQCTAIGEQNLCWIEDAFCTDAELSPQYENWQIPAILDLQCLRETISASSQTEATRVVDAWVQSGETIKQRLCDIVELQIPIYCNVLYYDAQGDLNGYCIRSAMDVKLPLHENGACRVETLDFGELSCKASANAIEIRLPVQLRVESFAEHPIHALCGAQLSEPTPQQGRRPSVILRRTQEQEDLWQIAKACRTSVRAIEQANGLEATAVPADTLLLIPM